MDQLIKYGEVKRGVLGVNIQTLTPDIAQSLGLDNTQGALVSQVVEGSAADKAGIKAGDVITSINGQHDRNAAELRNTIGLLRVGEKVDIGLLRDGKPRRVTAVIGERAAATRRRPAQIHPALEGAELADGTNGGGVLVQTVAAGSPAAQTRPARERRHPRRRPRARSRMSSSCAQR